METINKIRIWTYFAGTEEGLNDFISEWENLLGNNVVADLEGASDDGLYSWHCEAFVSQGQIDNFSMDRDWFTIQ
jgi:hypothetical protein